jgi:hypothetical protein
MRKLVVAVVLLAGCEAVIGTLEDGGAIELDAGAVESDAGEVDAGEVDAGADDGGLDLCAGVVCVPEEGCRASSRCEAGACVSDLIPDGTSCDFADGGAGVCSAGACAECVDVSDCAAPVEHPECSSLACVQGRCEATRLASVECRPASCAAGLSAPAVLCGTAPEACPEAVPVSCNGFRCQGVGCFAGPCMGPSDCATGNCITGQCAAPLPDGATCAADGECVSGHCADILSGAGSRCAPANRCAQPDAGTVPTRYVQCQGQTSATTCLAPGQWSPLQQNPDPTDSLCTPTGGPAGGGTDLRATCTSGVDAGFVDATCRSCAPYLAATASTCRTSCTVGDATSCWSNHFCDAGVCVPTCPTCAEDGVQVAKRAPAANGGLGYLQYLPDDYSQTTQTYPTIIFLHGSGERGNGTAAQLARVALHGPPLHIKNGHAMQFTVGGTLYKFIVLSPQQTTNFSGWIGNPNDPAPDGMQFINWARTQYRIDPRRLYLTGLSMGGQGTWENAASSTNTPNIFAALAPIACGSTYNAGRAVGMKNVPLWDFWGTADSQVTSSASMSPINGMNSVGAMPVPIYTTYQGANHGGTWERAYRTNNSLHTPNLYEWLLAQQLP